MRTLRAVGRARHLAGRFVGTPPAPWVAMNDSVAASGACEGLLRLGPDIRRRRVTGCRRPIVSGRSRPRERQQCAVLATLSLHRSGAGPGCDAFVINVSRTASWCQSSSHRPDERNGIVKRSCTSDRAPLNGTCQEGTPPGILLPVPRAGGVRADKTRRRTGRCVDPWHWSSPAPPRVVATRQPALAVVPRSCARSAGARVPDPGPCHRFSQAAPAPCLPRERRGRAEDSIPRGRRAHPRSQSGAWRQLHDRRAWQ